MNEWWKDMRSDPGFTSWADSKGLTGERRALAWDAWREGQEAIRRNIRESGDRPPR